jgi:hypothetical protein
VNKDEILSPEEWDGALLDAITSESGAMAWDRELKLRAHDLALRAQCEAERQARLDAERTLDETVTKLVRERTRATDAERERDFWLRKANDTVARAEAERDALAAALDLRWRPCSRHRAVPRRPPFSCIIPRGGER